MSNNAPYRLLGATASLWCAFAAQAQPYTQPLFGVDTTFSVIYGWDTNFYGGIDTLRMDIFKPVGDANTQRPLLLAVHGGAWVGGSRGDVWNMCADMAQRGYVAAAVSYRLGHHVPQNVNVSLGLSACSYAPDSAEILRALFRAQQDLKGAIRFMKARSTLDSTLGCNTFIYGESAGAITCLTAAFLDVGTERPLACGPLPDVADPSILLGGCFPTGLPLNSTQKTRPDLGPVEGDLNLNGEDSRVAGVASVAGALPRLAWDMDWLQGGAPPALFLYHQTCDMIVSTLTKPALFDLSFYCATGTWWSTNYPLFAGSQSIADEMATYPPGTFTVSNLQDPFLCDAVLSQPPFSFNCINVANNGSFHFVVNTAAVRDSLRRMFSPIIVQNEQVGCTTGIGAITGKGTTEVLTVAPNPAADAATVHLTTARQDRILRVFDVQGRVVLEQPMPMRTLDLDIVGYPPGPYRIVVSSATELIQSWLVVVG
ncbi:MAG: hypothetical protein ABI599_11860 [Flavobacteriales bacterium]